MAGRNVLSKVFFFWVVILGILFSISHGHAEEGANEKKRNWLQRHIVDRASATFRILGYGIVRDTVQTPLTVGREKELDLANYQFQSDLRPDLFWEAERLLVSVKPRFSVLWRDWDEGSLDGQSEFKVDAYVNEWLTRYKLRPDLFVSYGRENLQWGPSYLISPSNPFIRDNGKNNPKIEVAGSDFARMVWIPGARWSVSAIANTEEGEQDFISGFERAYAAKIDYTGDRKFLSIIPQYKEDDKLGVGYFCGWNLSDAFIVHSEGRVFDGEYELLGGGSYTLRWGPTLTAEYYHNSAGSTVDPIFRAFPPRGDVDPDSLLFRKNYLLLQFLDTGIKDVFNMTLRWVCDLDDGSTRSVAIFEYDVGNHLQLFAIGTYDSGGEGDEFGSAVKYSTFSGVQYTF